MRYKEIHELANFRAYFAAKANIGRMAKRSGEEAIPNECCQAYEDLGIDLG